MADTVAVHHLRASGAERYAFLTGISDGVGETGAIKIDKSTLSLNGAEPTLIGIRRIRSNIQGYSSLRLYWDRATDVLICPLTSGSMEWDFTDSVSFDDPGTGGTGDVILTSAGQFSGSTYGIHIWYTVY